MSMIEKVKRALAQSDPEFDPEWDYGEQARAVIQAMRDPTDEMIEAGYSKCGDGPFKAYRAMIDEALKDNA